VSYLRDLIYGPPKDIKDPYAKNTKAKVRTSSDGTISVETKNLVHEKEFLDQLDRLARQGVEPSGES